MGEMEQVIVLGIDPGIAIVGFGVIEKKGHQLRPIQYGSITTKSELRTEMRLKQIYEAMGEILHTYKPNVMAIEKLFFNRNVTTALTVGQARGVIMLASEQCGIPLAEYTPLQVKQAVVGYGAAQKQQVQEMVRTLLKLRERPKPDDVADALAIAICHAHSSQILSALEEKSKIHD